MPSSAPDSSFDWLDAYEAPKAAALPFTSTAQRAPGGVFDWLDAYEKKPQTPATAATAEQGAEDQFPETQGYGTAIPRRIEPPAVAAMARAGGMPTQDVPDPTGATWMNVLKGLGTNWQQIVGSAGRHLEGGVGDVLRSAPQLLDLGGPSYVKAALAKLAPQVKVTTPGEYAAPYAEELAKPFLESAAQAPPAPEPTYRDNAPAALLSDMAGAAGGAVPFVMAGPGAPAVMAATGAQSAQDAAIEAGASPAKVEVARHGQALIDSIVGELVPHRIAKVLGSEMAAGTPIGNVVKQAASTVASSFATLFAQAEADHGLAAALHETTPADHVAMAKDAFVAALTFGMAHAPHLKEAFEARTGMKLAADTQHGEDHGKEDAAPDQEGPQAAQGGQPGGQVPLPDLTQGSGPRAEITPRGPEAGGVANVKTAGIADAIAAAEQAAPPGPEPIKVKLDGGVTIEVPRLPDQAPAAPAPAAERRSSAPPPEGSPMRRVSDMSPQEMQQALLRDSLTGLPNYRAWMETAPEHGPVKVKLDLDSFKGLNTALGHEGADQALAAVGDVARSAGLGDVLHRASSSGAGDEFMAHFPDQAAADAAVSRLRELVPRAEFAVRFPDGATQTFTGVDFSHGIGPTIEAADADLTRNKEWRAAQALRAAGREAAPIGLRRAGDSAPGRAERGSEDRVGQAALGQDVVRGAAGVIPTHNVPFRWSVSESRAVQASHDSFGNENAAYPHETGAQNRDRSRVDSRTQILEIANNHDPRLLADSASMREGAPTTMRTPEGVEYAVAGNGRKIGTDIALQDPAKREAYRRYILDNADRFGFSPEQVARIAAMDRPILHRAIEGDTRSAQELGELSNEKAGRERSATEIAAADHKRLTPEILSLYRDTEGGISSAANRDFVKAFVAAVPANDRGALVDSSGQVSQQGLSRLRNAVLKAAYDDPRVVERIVESTDSDAGNVGRALVSAAPALARLRALAESGDAFSGLDMAPDVTRAAKEFWAAKEKGEKIADRVAQTDMVDPRSPTADRLLTFLDQNVKSPNRISEVLRRYAELADGAGHADQESLIPMPEPDKLELLNRAIDDVATGKQEKLYSPGAKAGADRVTSSAPAEGFTGPRLGSQDVLRELGKIWSKLPVRIGRLAKEAAGALGQYDPFSREARIRKAGDIATAAHEVGHDLWKSWGRRLSFQPEVRAELEKMGHELYPDPTDPPAGGYQQEGFAEYLRKRWASPQDLATDAPKTHAAIESELEKRPTDRKRMLASDELYRRYRDQGALNRAKAAMNLDAPKKLGLISTGKGTVEAADKPSFSERVDRSFRSLKHKALDPWSPLDWATRHALDALGQHWTDVPADKRAYTLAEANRKAAAAKVKQMALYGVHDLDGNRLTRSLAEALRPFKPDQYPDVAAYLYARHTLEAPGDTGLSREDAAAIVKDLDSAGMRKASEIWNEWNNGVVDYAVQRSHISLEAGERLKRYTAYVPLRRVFTEAFEKGQTPGGAGGRFYRRKEGGSQRPIQDILTSTLQQAESVVRAADNTQIANALFDVLDKAPEMAWLSSPVPVSTERRQFAMRSIADQLEALGFDPADIKEHGDDLLTLFSNAGLYKGPDPIVSRVKNGQIEWRQIGDPVLYQALSETQHQMLPTAVHNTKLAKLVAGVASLTRLGATGANVGFAWGTNLLRDAQTALLQSGGGFVTASTVRAMLANRTNDALAKEANRLYYLGGGELSGQLGASRDMIATLREEMMDRGFVDKLKTFARHPVDVWTEWLSTTESWPRRGEFLRVYENALKRGETKSAAWVEAQAAAANITVNFRRIGASMQEFARYTAFMTAAIAGPVQMAHTMFTNPKTGELAMRRRADGSWDIQPKNFNKRSAFVGLAMLTGPAFAQYLRHRDDEWYQELPVWEKVAYMHFQVPEFVPKIGGEIVRLPMPFEWGMAFATLPVAAWDYWYTKNGRDFKDKAAAMANNMMPSIIPNLVAPIYEISANRSLLTGDKLESDRVSGRLSEDRAYENASQVYVALARIANKVPLIKSLNLSPIGLQHVVEGWTGGVTRTLTDQFKEPGQKEAADLPVIGRFFSRQNRAGDSVRQLYDIRKEATEAFGSIQYYTKKGDMARVAQIEKEHEDVLGLDPDLHGQWRYPLLHRLNEAAAKLKDLSNDPSITDKRELAHKMNHVARVALGKDRDDGDTQP